MGAKPLTDIKKILTVWAMVCGYNNLRRMLEDDLTPRGYVDLLIKDCEAKSLEARRQLQIEVEKPIPPEDVLDAHAWEIGKYVNEYRVKSLKTEIIRLEAEIQRLESYLVDLF